MLLQHLVDVAFLDQVEKLLHVGLHLLVGSCNLLSWLLGKCLRVLLNWVSKLRRGSVSSGFCLSINLTGLLLDKLWLTVAGKCLLIKRRWRSDYSLLSWCLRGRCLLFDRRLLLLSVLFFFLWFLWLFSDMCLRGFYLRLGHCLYLMNLPWLLV